MSGEGWAVWFVGLPGSGKSSVAVSVLQELEARELAPHYLQMDERRRAYFPELQYTPEERARAYEMFVREAADLVLEGKKVVMDGTAPRVAMRDRARELIQKFAEIHISCSLHTAMAREGQRSEGLVMAGLYAKAVERKNTGREFPGLGPVVGVDVPFEESGWAELRVDNDGDKSLQDAVDEVMNFLQGWLPLDG